MSKLGDMTGKKLKQFRLERHLTQEHLAEKASLARATINRWEKGGAGSATLDDIEIVAQSMGIYPSDLLGLAIETKPEKVELPKNQWELIQKHLLDSAIPAPESDPLIKEIDLILPTFDESQKRGVLRYVEGIKRATEAAAVKGKGKKIN